MDKIILMFCGCCQQGTAREHNGKQYKAAMPVSLSCSHTHTHTLTKEVKIRRYQFNVIRSYHSRGDS